MKKILALLFLLLLPALANADIQFGVISLYDGDIISAGSTPSASALVYGLETRAKLWIFQVSGTAFFVPLTPGAQDVLALADAGLAFNLWFIRLGLSAGWNFWYSPTGAYPMSLLDGLNLKIIADINIGFLTLGLVSYSFLPASFDSGTLGSQLLRFPVLGITAMLKLGK